MNEREWLCWAAGAVCGLIVGHTIGMVVWRRFAHQWRDLAMDWRRLYHEILDADHTDAT